MSNFIEIKNLKKTFKMSSNNQLLLFENLNLNISKNSTTSIIGPSGCGKSTLLNIVGLLDSSFHGEYFFDGILINNINKSKLNEIKNLKIGFVHQFFHLIPELSVMENIILPALIKKDKISDINNDADNLLKVFEIFDKKNMKPNKLSGGEQQRVAIARSLINKPSIILADEMTGNLDEKTSDEIIKFFLKFVANHQISLMYVTHNQKYADMADIKYELKNKNLVAK